MAFPVHHVSIQVAELEPAERFYREVFGFERLPRPDLGIEGVWLGLPDGLQLHLIVAAGWVPPRGPHLAFRVDDLDAEVARLVELGVDVRGPVPVGAGRQAFLADPAGNGLELNEPPVEERP